MLSKEQIVTEKLDSEKRQQEDVRVRKDIADKAKPRCKTCHRYLYENPRCLGHGGGGVGSDDSESSSKDDPKTLPDDATDKAISAISRLVISAVAAKAINIDTGPKADAPEKSLDSEQIAKPESMSEVIAMLLAEKLLVISSDRSLRMLIIKLQCDPNSLSAEQKNELKKFMHAILSELDAFKKENGLSAMSSEKIKQDANGNILFLSITLPTLKLYDDFIAQLVDKNLLPTKSSISCFNPTLLATKPTPQSKSKELTENEQTLCKK